MEAGFGEYKAEILCQDGSLLPEAGRWGRWCSFLITKGAAVAREMGAAGEEGGRSSIHHLRKSLCFQAV